MEGRAAFVVLMESSLFSLSDLSVWRRACVGIDWLVNDWIRVVCVSIVH